MKVNDDVYVLPLPRPNAAQPSNPFNVSLILDATRGATLVDTGLPGSLPEISAALAELGLGLNDLGTIIITHQDLDHVGSLHALVEASGARVLAGSVEAPTIDGTELPRFGKPEILGQFPEMRAAFERFSPTPIDELLEDGQRLELGGGILVVFTPGHTPGHTCLFLERSRTLIAGDALTAQGGRLQAPNAQATEDMATATESVRKLAALDVETIVCYHGGLVSEDAAGQLRRVAQELAQR